MFRILFMQFRILFYLILISTPFYPQEVLSEKDFDRLQERVKYNFNSNLDSVFYFSVKIEKSKDFLHKAFAEASKGYYYQLKGNVWSSNERFRLAESLLEKVKISKRSLSIKTYLLNLKGLSAWKKREYSTAINNFESGKAISQRINDRKQIIKFNNNIASVNADIGNYNRAIKTYKESFKINENLKSTFSPENYLRNSSNYNLQIGYFYLEFYGENKLNVKYLDSAQFFLEKAVVISEDFLDNKIRAENNLGKVFFYKNDLKKAEELYMNSVLYSKENNIPNQYSISKYGLGEVYFKMKEYDKSLICLKDVDSIYKIYGENTIENVKSNLLLSKIYKLKNDNLRALYHLERYSGFLEDNKFNLINQSKIVNILNGKRIIDNEIEVLKKEVKHAKTKEYGVYVFLASLFFGLIYLVIKNNIEKRIANKKIENIISEYRDKVNNNNNNNIQTVNNKLSIASEKEVEILEKLKKLEEKKYFLSSDFNLLNVAQKVKTNTTYLSNVVNKNYEKTFSEYSNELKINYAINELINNNLYRKYTTQAIAESVGFKSAISFTKSFKKRGTIP